MARPKTFTCTIYCGNCRNVGDYEFRRGTILHADRKTTWAEYRDFVPRGDDTQEIRLNDRVKGKRVECKFCRCETALHLRERKGDTVAAITVSGPEAHLALLADEQGGERG